MKESREVLLPSIPLPSDTVEINGTTVRFRSLSRTEAIKLTTQFTDNPDAAEVFVLSCGVGVSEDEAKEWLQSTDPTTAGKLIDGIILLTGMVGDNNPKN